MKFKSYEEIEKTFGMSRSDAQAWADVHPELLTGELKDEVEMFNGYFEEHHGKSEIHNYGNIKFISKDEHGCSIDEAWIPTYQKKDGTIVRGHCRNMNNEKPLSTYEIHALYDRNEWNEIEKQQRKRRKEYGEKRRSLR